MRTGIIAKLLNKLDEEINPATEDTLQKLLGFSLPEYDQIDLTYVASGDGVGEIETVIYKKDGATVAALTLSYNSDNNLTSVTRSE